MRLDEIELITGNLERCRLFYAGTLGFEVVEVSENSICFSVGTSKIRFRQELGTRPLYHLAFSIPNNMLEPALAWLRERSTVLPYSVDSVIADFIGWNAKAFYFRDADQNILECITHFDEQSFRPGAFSAACFSSIMEIGLAVEDVQETCAGLNERYGLPYFIKGPRLKDFSVMGDAEGMLIVTKKGRGWLPTQEAAESFPTSILLTQLGVGRRLEFA
ncbi:MAG: hypothetical protein V4725_19310 [Bacteroidota bacterium]